MHRQCTYNLVPDCEEGVVFLCNYALAARIVRGKVMGRDVVVFACTVCICLHVVLFLCLCIPYLEWWTNLSVIFF